MFAHQLAKWKADFCSVGGPSEKRGERVPCTRSRRKSIAWSVNCCAKTKPWQRPPRCWPCKKSSGRPWGGSRMTAHEGRKQAIVLLNESIASGARQAQACDVPGLSGRTLQRWQAGGVIHAGQRPLRDHRPPHKLTDIERSEVLAVANSKEFGHLPPSQIVPRLAGQGIYLASESTFYRITGGRKPVGASPERTPGPSPHQTPGSLRYRA